MAGASAEAPAGNHHVFAMKKYVLTNVISQITIRRTRPIARNLPGHSSDFRTRKPVQSPENGRIAAASGTQSITAPSVRKQLIPGFDSSSPVLKMSCTPLWYRQKHALTNLL